MSTPSSGTPPMATPLTSLPPGFASPVSPYPLQSPPTTPPRSDESATPPASPDCLLSLRDGSMLAVSSAGVPRMLQQHHLIRHSYSLPIYYVDEEPDVVHLLHNIHTDSIDTHSGVVPPMSVLCSLARLCIKTGRMDICETYICPWVKRWMIASWNHLTAEGLEVALICGNHQIVAEVCRGFILGVITHEEVRKAECLLEGLPDSIQISVLRHRLREEIRALLRLLVEDHPSINAPVNDTHWCVTQSRDLVSLLRALRSASLFPMPNDDSAICLMWLGERIQAVKQGLRPIEACRVCSFTGTQWCAQLDEIAKRMNVVVRQLMRSLKAHLISE